MSSNLPMDLILTGDCVEVMAQLPDNSIDMIFADPPYNLQLSQDLWRPNHTRVTAVDDQWDKFDSFEDYDRFTLAWLSACRRILKDTGTIWVIGTYHNIFRVGAILQDLGFWILNDVVYIKTNPMPNFRGVRFTNAHETLIWAQKKKGAKYIFNHKAMKSLNDDLQMRSDWQLQTCTGQERIRVNGVRAHSTQKPEALLYRVLLSSSNPGDIVLDPFFGTGTTGAVAKKLGRHFIGIEGNEGYVKIAQERIDKIVEAPGSTLNIPNPRRQTRIPFGTLLENGTLQPGQELFFMDGKTHATILANGHVECNNEIASIHGIARKLTNGAQGNGWMCWYYEDANGVLKLIDSLRQNIRSASSND